MSDAHKSAVTRCFFLITESSDSIAMNGSASAKRIPISPKLALLLRKSSRSVLSTTIVDRPIERNQRFDCRPSPKENILGNGWRTPEKQNRAGTGKQQKSTETSWRYDRVETRREEARSSKMQRTWRGGQTSQCGQRRQKGETGRPTAAPRVTIAGDAQSRQCTKVAGVSIVKST